jgi:glycosyltransferase involved in cell wall biosynthesis
VAFISSVDPTDRRAWSGTLTSMYAALGETHDVTSLGPARPSAPVRAVEVVRWALARATKRSHLRTHTWAVARDLGATFDERLRGKDFDAGFAPIASAELAGLGGDLPIVYASDATFRLLEGYYERFTGLTTRAARQADELERAAMGRAAALVYPSTWAAQSAIDDYGADPARVFVAPYGANLAPPPAPAPSPPLDRWRLLFLAASWHRKGGDLALEAAEELQRRGHAVELTVCGSSPSRSSSVPVVTIPFLDKNDSDQASRLASVIAANHVLLLPTRAECYGIVFCEAGAFGLPSVTTATGGVPDVVRDGVNGLTLSLEAEAADYADALERMLGDEAGYEQWRARSRQEYDRRLNWRAWGDALCAVLDSVVGSDR